MKILHMADIHLDSVLNTHLDDRKRKERRQEILAAFVRAVEYASAQDIGHIIIAGDLFDTEVVSRTTANAVYRCITDHENISFYYLKGNHDADSFIANMEEKPGNLYLFGYQWESYELASGVRLYGIELKSGNDADWYESLKMNPADFNIVTIHGQTGEYESKDKADNIALGRLKNIGIDYLALGHVHEYSCDMLDARGIWCYPGCLEPRGFDECGSHGFCVLEIDEDTHESEHNFIHFNKRKCVELKIDISGCMESTEAVNIIHESLKDEAEGEDLVKLVLTGAVDAESEINTDYIYQNFKDVFYFLKIVDKTRVAVDFAKYEYDQSLRGEFIRSVKADTSIDDDMKGQIIRTGLMALAGEEY